MNDEKLNFLKTDFVLLLESLPGDAKGNWGKMNAQQMVEHVSGFFKISSNKLHFDLVTPVEHLSKFKEFLMSEKEFRENTKAPVLPDTQLPLTKRNMQEALEELKDEINDFIEFFSGDEAKKTLHPVFGELNFEEWVQLHHKHVKHHLRQFGLLIRDTYPPSNS